MLTIDSLKLIILIISFVVFLFLAANIGRTVHQKLMLILSLTGLFLYNGLATADEVVSINFLFAYIIFSLMMILGFLIGKTTFTSIGITISRNVPFKMHVLEQNGYAKYIIILYILLHLVELVTPEFRLHLLLTPSPPDIYSWFLSRFDQDYSPVKKVTHYIETLSTPFFYLALYSFRRKITYIVMILVGVAYIKYVALSYIGRSSILFDFVFVFLVIWFTKPEARRILVILTLLFTPILLIFFHAYSIIRLGIDLSDINFEMAISSVLESEFSFFLKTGIPLIESGKNINLLHYFTWILTLPIPGFFKGGLEIALVNYEISEIVLGRAVGEKMFYVVLPGLLAESFYIYGEYFFWLHAMFIGFIAAFFCRCFEKVPHFMFLYFYVAIMFFYNLNRGGVGSLLPSIINEFVLYYIFVGVLIYQSQNARKSIHYLKSI